MRITWKEAELAAQNKLEWRQSAAQMHPLERGLNQGQGQVFIKSAINYI